MFQFIRAEVYARRASTNEKSKSQFNASDVIGEALRDEGHCPHVEKPEAPRYLLGSEAGTRAILGRIQENAAQYRDKMGRKMREDAAVLLAGVASFPRDAANKDPDLYARWESLTVEYLQKKYGDNLRAVVMHNDEEHPHIHFYVYSDTEVNAKMLHDGYKNGSSPKAYKKGCEDFQNEYFEQVASRCGLARTGPKRRRLSRAEWHAEQEMAMSISKAESAVLDSAATKEKEAHKRLQAVQEHAELLAKEKRATREAMQKALALQAEAREKIAQSEALLAQYGLADVPPQPTPPQKGAEATPAGEFGL
jgi:hypothetical protein